MQAEVHGLCRRLVRLEHSILRRKVVNLAAVPLTGVVVPLGFLALVTGLVWQPLGKIVAVPLAWLTELLLHIVQWFAHFPRWSYRIPGPPWWLIVAFFAVAVLLAAMMRSKQSPGYKLRWSLYAAWATFALAVAVFPFGSQWSKGKLEVTILDVGQGDSLFVVSPGGKILLIDGGGAFGGFPGHEEQQGVDPGGVSRPEDSPGISIIAVRLLQVLIPSRVGYPRVSSIRQGRVVPETRAAGVIVFRAGKWSIVVITAIGEVILGLNKFFGNGHGVGTAIRDAGKGGFRCVYTDDAAPGVTWEIDEKT